ncbi:MAG: dTDP-4-dehydrorhamnose 3,5-epimerase family protein [Spirochaetales bacterium]|nr:dTDP-4-dehydrorhamnose 3,5-epimerase family protein [Spirochaetales bacterium]
MKIVSVVPTALPDVLVMRFARFRDERGYFSEPFRRSDVDGHPALAPLAGRPVLQVNESWSRAGVIRGLHFQWNPFMGKLVRTLAGRMVDIALDIRLDSPTLGQAVLVDLPADPEGEKSDWIWVPPGFAHGNFFTAPTLIEYFCTGEYSPGNEAGISPFSDDIDWSLCDPALRKEFERLKSSGPLVSAKDKNGLALKPWLDDPRSRNFVYGRC